jgi:hypothetical protein
MSFYIGLVGLLTVVLGLAFFVLRVRIFSRAEKIFLLWGTGIFFISIFMMNYRSAFLWRSIPLLPYFQFPWRFLAMIVFSSPIFLLGISKFKHQKLISLVVITFAVVLNFNYFKTSEYLGREDSYYLNRYIPYPVASAEYRKTGEEYLRLPLATLTRPDSVFPRAYVDGPAKTQIQEINALDAIINTDSTKEFILNYNKYDYPGWSAKIDKQRVPIVAGMPYGQITLSVPGGKHTVEVSYRESPLREVFDIVSLMGLCFSLFLILKKK